MRVVHITPTISRLGGGVAEYIWRFCEHGQQAGIDPTVVGLWDRHVAEDAAGHAGIPFHAVRPWGPRAAGYAPSMRVCLDAVPADLVHSHGLRMMPSLEARRLADRRAVPRVVSSHGQLDPWVLKTKPIRKWVVGQLFENRNLRTADCLHATVPQEARHARAAGLRIPVAVVPIGLDVARYGSEAIADAEGVVVDRWPGLSGKKRLLYLATIYRKKGLMRLAQAWARLHRGWPDWDLVVTGIELNNDRAIAEEILEKAGARERALFTGPVDDATKRALLVAGDVYVLPTDGENFGITIAESLASRTPVVTSNTTPWPDLRRRGCGWWVGVGVDPLCAALEEAMALPDDERQAMGERGRALIVEKFDWAVVAQQMAAVYGWLLGRGDRPACMYLEGDELPDA